MLSSANLSTDAKAVSFVIKANSKNTTVDLQGVYADVGHNIKLFCQ